MTMTAPADTIQPQSTMGEVLAAYPGAQRALFRRYHIGGCSSCGFQPTETLADVCRRNNNLDVAEVLAHIRTSHEQDAKIFVTAKELARLRAEQPKVRLLDVRSRAEFDAVRIEGAVLLTQPVMQEILGQWPRQELVVIYDHEGKQALDAAAYFAGHGFQQVRCLQGGIDAWVEEVDESVPRYQLA